MRSLLGFADEYRNLYNQLPDVELASTNVSRAKLSEFLRAFGNLASHHEMAGVVGAFLLHRHFLIPPGHVLLEQPGEDERGKQALVTKVVDESTAPASAKATRWMTRPHGDFVPLEFSTDNGALDGHRKVADDVRFRTEFAKLLSRHGLADSIGLCIAKRAHVEASIDHSLVERNSVSASVVTAEGRENAQGENWLPTVWVPDRDGTGHVAFHCEWFCVSYGPDQPHGRAHRVA